jgi:hypothetical protein
MARTRKVDTQLFNRLRTRGLRKSVAQNLAEAVGGARRRRKPPKAVARVVGDLRQLASELEDRATGAPAKRKAAAKKAAETRKRNAAKRSAAAKKGARTRAKSRS